MTTETKMLPPWFSHPTCPEPVKGRNLPCGGPLCLEPYNPSGWYGPREATVFCMACGTGRVGSDEQVEQSLIAETWMDARDSHPEGYAAFDAEQAKRRAVLP